MKHTFITIISACVLFVGINCKGFVTPGQSPDNPDVVCTPTCTHCGTYDGCGDICTCPDGKVCSSQGACVLEDTCTQTCSDVNWQCGEICGESCGSCGSDQICYEGTCLGEKDVSCEDCSLTIEVTDKEDIADGVQQVSIAVMYKPLENQPLPRIADIRLQIPSGATIVDVKAGDALTNADKSLYLDPISNKPWRIRKDNQLQLLALSTTNTTTIEAGILAIITLTHPHDIAMIKLLKRDQIFAPSGADSAIQTRTYEQPVVVVQ